MTPADVLREALARLDGGKLWVKGQPPEGWYCALSALPDTSDETWETAEELLCRAALHPDWEYEVPDSGTVIVSYNDDPATKWPDIEALYHRAIKLAEEQG